MLRFSTALVILLSICFISHAQDITVSMAGKTTFAPNEEFANDITVKNNGIVATASFYTSVYISTDNLLHSTDEEIAYISISSLAAGASRVLTKSTTASLLTSPGNYYLIIKADQPNTVEETDETNNLFITPITVTSSQIDFSFSAFSLNKTSFTQNERISFAYTISNSGTANAGGFLEADLYLSTNATWSADDKYLYFDNHSLNGVNGMTRKATDNSFYYILNSTVGNYYLIAKIDPDNNFNELSKTNNIISTAITIQAANVDLTIDYFTQNSANSYFIEVTAVIKNNGTTPAGPLNIDGFFNTYEYVSSPPLTSQYIMPGETKYVYLNFFYYNPGTYPLTLKVNLSQSIAETNYSNNSYTALVTLNPPPVESLVLRNLSFGGVYDNTDKDLILNLSVENTGNAVSYPYYTVEIRNAANVLVHSQNITSKYYYSYTGMPETTPVNLNLSSPLPPGQYQTLIKCNSSYGCKTSFDVSTVDLIIQPIQYTLIGTIKDEDGTPITKGNLFLYQKTDAGTVKFIQKITPTSSTSFSFQVDQHKHTLYFIPDRQAYPDYVPTVFGKTLTLENESLFELTKDSSVVFSIIKIQPLLAQGNGIISGTVTNESSAAAGRISSLSAGTPVANAPVLLLSPTGIVNGLTYTNASGYYEFTHLPRAAYQLLVPHELNVTGMEDPYPVNIVTKNAEINFTAGAEEVTIQQQVLLLDQEISFDPLSSVSYGASPVNLSAHSSSGLPVSFSVSDPLLAEIKDGQLIIKGAGPITINALQQGNDFYKEATLSRELLINKAQQQIQVNEILPIKFGQEPIPLTAQSTSGLPVIFSSSNEAIALVKNGQLIINGVGSFTLTAKQTGSNLYEEATRSRELLIDKGQQHIQVNEILLVKFGHAPITLTAQSTSGLPVVFSSSDEEIASVKNGQLIINGIGSFTLTAKQTGNNLYEEAIAIQTINVDKGEQQIIFNLPSAKTFGDVSFAFSATTSSSLPVTLTSSDPTIATVKDGMITLLGAGDVTFIASQAGNNYYSAASSVTRELSINKATQTITFDVLPELQFPADNLNLSASASSSLQVTFTSGNDNIVSIQNGKAIIHTPGTTTIMAHQSGDRNYKAAGNIERTLVINQVTGTYELASMVSIYPNPTSDFVFIRNAELIDELEVVDMLGRTLPQLKLSGNSIDIRDITLGTYILKFTSMNKAYSLRLVKN